MPHPATQPLEPQPLAPQPLAPQPLEPRSIEDLVQLIDVELGPTRWHAVTHEHIRSFADLTGDHQWIHVDPERAAQSEFGTTIAHALYSLSRGAAFFAELVSTAAFAHTLHYGYDRVRFPAPLPAGSRVRMRARLLEVRSIEEHVVNTVTEQVFEREGHDKPIGAAHAIARYTERPA